MPKIKILGGGETECSPEDFALITIGDVVVRGLMTNVESEKIIGCENAVLIRDALGAAGFKLVYSG